jgi:hypothetical protein
MLDVVRVGEQIDFLEPYVDAGHVSMPLHDAQQGLQGIEKHMGEEANKGVAARARNRKRALGTEISCLIASQRIHVVGSMSSPI